MGEEGNFIDKFTKWFITSFLLGIIGLIAVFFVQDLARITGEYNRSTLLIGNITIFILIFFSLFSIVKANANKIKSELIISTLVSIIPLSALIINGLIVTVYFVGK